MAHIHCQSQYSFWLSKNAGGQTRWQLTATETADVTVQGQGGGGNVASSKRRRNSQLAFGSDWQKELN